ncbi:hypothetical protein HDU84_004743 [Entophlyctis sp. JEL0112]|nr:hypothetical protein HDU84_004743 [Entophlyctis sp. JEL0112]
MDQRAHSDLPFGERDTSVEQTPRDRLRQLKEEIHHLQHMEDSEVLRFGDGDRLQTDPFQLHEQLARINSVLSAAGFPSLALHTIAASGMSNKIHLIETCDSESTIATVNALLTAVEALSAAHAEDSDRYSIAMSNVHVLEERVARYKREVSKLESTVLMLRETRREADDECRDAKQQLKNTDRELRNVRTDFLKLVEKLNVKCCEDGLKQFIHSPNPSPSSKGRSDHHGLPCAKCFAKLRQHKFVTAEWIDGVGFVDAEDSDVGVVMTPIRRRGVGSIVPRPSTPTRRAVSQSTMAPQSLVNRPQSPIVRSTTPTITPPRTPTTPTPKSRPSMTSTSTQTQAGTASIQTTPAATPKAAGSTISIQQIPITSPISTPARVSSPPRIPRLMSPSSTPKTVPATLDIDALASLLTHQTSLLSRLLHTHSPTPTPSASGSSSSSSATPDMSLGPPPAPAAMYSLEAANALIRARLALARDRAAFEEEVRAFKVVSVLAGVDDAMDALEFDGENAAHPIPIADTTILKSKEDSHREYSFSANRRSLDDESMVSIAGMVDSTRTLALNDDDILIGSSYSLVKTHGRESESQQPPSPPPPKIMPAPPPAMQRTLSLRPSTQELLSQFRLEAKAFLAVPQTAVSVQGAASALSGVSLEPTHAAVFPYTSPKAEELSLLPGDLLHVDGAFVGGVGHAVNLSQGGVAGLVAEWCLRRIEDYAAEANTTA